MATINNLNLGASPNDKTGTPIREGGQIINDNFANLNADKLEQSDIDSQLGNVDNTSDSDKPISTAAAAKNATQDSAIALNTAKRTYPSADETKLAGIEASAEVNTINSDPTGITGADQVTNVVSLTQAQYDAITPNSSTTYLITDA